MSKPWAETHSFVSDIGRGNLYTYNDPTATTGLQRGACVDGNACQFSSARLQTICGGIVAENNCTFEDSYSFSIEGTDHTLYGFPPLSWWALLNEDTKEPANHRFQVWDLVIQAPWVLGGADAEERPPRRQRRAAPAAQSTCESLNVSVVGIVQVAGIGESGRCTIYYGLDYNRDGYGDAKPSTEHTELAEQALWDLLAEHGLRGKAAVEAVLERAAPTDSEDLELRKRLRAWRMARGSSSGQVHQAPRLSAPSCSPAPLSHILQPPTSQPLLHPEDKADKAEVKSPPITASLLPRPSSLHHSQLERCKLEDAHKDSCRYTAPDKRQVGVSKNM